MTRRPRKPPALLEDGQQVACDHRWLGMSHNAAYWLSFTPGPLWYCPACKSYTRSPELVAGADAYAAAMDRLNAHRAAYLAYAANGYREVTA